MSKLDDQLNRLLRAGAKGEKGDRCAEVIPPFGFASRVLAEWRASSAESADLSCAILCKRAVLCSYGVAALVFLLNIQALESFRGLNAWHAADVRLLDSAMQLHIP
jgi:hypothetical protein